MAQGPAAGGGAGVGVGMVSRHPLSHTKDLDFRK